MGAPTASMKCPSCGTPLQAVLGPSTATQWFPCPNCHQPVPFVPPRELPPLYSWEVSPGLYPPQPVPRRTRIAWRKVAAGALAVAAAFAAVTAGVLGVAGFQAAEPSTCLVSGTVYEVHAGGSVTPARGVSVVLFTDDNRSSQSTTTSSSGSFSFSDVPNGGILIHVPGPLGYQSSDVYTFASRSYSAATRGLAVSLDPGPSSNTTSAFLSPYPDLESFLSYVGGGAVLIGVVALVAGVAGWELRKPDGAVIGVLGSGASIAFPVVILSFSLDTAFPLTSALAGVAGGLGAFSLVLTAAALASGPAWAEPT